MAIGTRWRASVLIDWPAPISWQSNRTEIDWAYSFVIPNNCVGERRRWQNPVAFRKYRCTLPPTSSFFLPGGNVILGQGGPLFFLSFLELGKADPRLQSPWQVWPFGGEIGAFVKGQCVLCCGQKTSPGYSESLQKPEHPAKQHWALALKGLQREGRELWGSYSWCADRGSTMYKFCACGQVTYLLNRLSEVK